MAKAVSATPARAMPAADYSATDWRTLNGNDYQLADIYAMSAAQVGAIRQTVARAWEIISAVAPIARALTNDVLAEFGIPPLAWDIVRTIDPAAPETLLGRFDLIETPTGYRIIEFNAETPFFIVESHEIAGQAARACGYSDPNADCADTLGAAIARAIGATGPELHVAVAAHDASFEDRSTAHYLRDLIARFSAARVTCVPLRSLRVRTAGLWSPTGRIDVLYRLYPLEQLAADRPAAHIFELVRSGRLRLINPASALIVQSKMLMVVIWGLAQRDDILTPAQCRVVRESFLPTFADLPDDGKTYVAKCVLGREGASIAILHPDGSAVQSSIRLYDGQPRVYQQYTPLPHYRGRTLSGKIVDGRVLTTCFVVAGEPGAVGIRIGGEITDGRAYFAPVG